MGWIVAFTLFGGVLSVLAASLFLMASASLRRRLVPHLVSFATGTLLGAALLGLLPHAIESAGEHNVHNIGLAVLGGILLFFVLEKLVLWRHCHHDDCEAHAPDDHQRDAASASMVLLGDGLHNLIDGVLIAAAFLTDIRLGIVTSMAAIAHEIPQEIGEFAVLLNGGMSRRKAMLSNVLISLTTVVGGIVAYFALARAGAALPYVLAVAASSFLYVAVADLIPGLHRRFDARTSVVQVALIALGVVLIYVSHSAAH
ncbi:MAG: ZIP family metal transporter [Pseudomonadota bacterium]